MNKQNKQYLEDASNQIEAPTTRRILLSFKDSIELMHQERKYLTILNNTPNAPRGNTIHLRE